MTAGAVYVVLSHRDWPQVRRLAGAILRSSPSARVVVVHDDRQEAFPATAGDDRIEIRTHGLATDWGSWELVEATLDAFAHARRAYDPRLVVLISGQDYPARPLGEWEAEALAAPSWIGRAQPLRYTPRWGRRRGDGDDRLTRYAYRWFRSPASRWGMRPPVRLAAAWRWVRSAIALRLEPLVSARVVARGRGVHYGVRRLRSPFTAEQPCWFGDQWVAVRREELDRLLDVDLAPGSRLRRVYRRSIIPDESALVTPLSWIAPPAALPRVSHHRWDDDADRVLTWTLDDLDAIVASGSPFCRKVEAGVSDTLMDALDERTAPAG
ncbi:hypothetical protein [Microbacterium sp.]|uniref:hypothetical protein n=1 Tax=Microbacterium sp. TaxID=51671 RepID=UPI00281251BD|nr:hypothetical protein [Microbacterium sp.]